MNGRESAQLVLRCLPDGEVVSVLSDARCLLGEAPVGRPLGSLLDFASADKCERFLRAVAAHGGAFGWEMNASVGGAPLPLCFAAMRADDGQLWVVATRSGAGTLRLLNDALSMSTEALSMHSSSRVGSSWDPLDELARVNNALVTAQRKLVKRHVELANLTEERNRLLGVLAHDLRGPVAMIHGVCELLRSNAQEPLSSAQDAWVVKIEYACERLTTLLEHTLTEARATATHRKLSRMPLDVVELVRDDIENHQVIAAHKDIALELRVPAPIPQACLDATGIHQVVSNLLSNAIKYSHAHSQVTVSLAAVDGEIELAVEDRGQGIPAEEVGLLFEPYRVTSVRPTAGESSAGLGLSIVREVVEAHGGKVRVESTVQRGSTFIVRLPLARPHELRSGIA